MTDTTQGAARSQRPTPDPFDISGSFMSPHHANTVVPAMRTDSPEWKGLVEKGRKCLTNLRSVLEKGEEYPDKGVKRLEPHYVVNIDTSLAKKLVKPYISGGWPAMKLAVQSMNVETGQLWPKVSDSFPMVLIITPCRQLP